MTAVDHSPGTTWRSHFSGSTAMLYEPRFHVVLHQPEIPQNTGNIGRTCVAAGAWLWLVRPLGFRLDSTHRRRAGLDYWDQLHYRVVAHWDQLVEELQLDDSRWWYFTKHAGQPYCAQAYQLGDALVFGSETQGLPESLWKSRPRQAVMIPMRSEVRSLNLASAAAVGVFEACRRIGCFET